MSFLFHPSSQRRNSLLVFVWNPICVSFRLNAPSLSINVYNSSLQPTGVASRDILTLSFFQQIGSYSRFRIQGRLLRAAAAAAAASETTAIDAATATSSTTATTTIATALTAISMVSTPGALWARSTKNPDESTGPLARPFACSLVGLLRPACFIRALRCAHSFARPLF